jgi:hypothetical protein
MAHLASDVRAYYTAALAGLRYVEGRRPTGRRFGPEADARWSNFRGDLTAADRMDLLLRDADAEWPSAFGARTTFDERAVAEDDAFGAGWPGLAPVEAEEVWRNGARLEAQADLDALFLAWSRAWDASLGSFEVGPLTTSALVVAGPSAIAAVIRGFVGRSDLSLSEQVTFVASSAAHRQLAALSTAIVGSAKAPRIVSSGAVTGKPLVSDDALAADASIARSAA